MKESAAEQINAALGFVFLTLGAVTAVAIFVDGWTSLNLYFPDIWYQFKNFHVLFCVLLFAVGWWAHRQARHAHRRSERLFSSVRVYSKPDCELCDRALDALRDFSELLPAIEVVDISQDPILEERHRQSIPVIEIDGRVRFRGVVSAELLQRMIDARQKQAGHGLKVEEDTDVSESASP